MGGTPTEEEVQGLLQEYDINGKYAYASTISRENREV